MHHFIQQGPDKYFLKTRGAEMTLEKKSEGRWVMYTVNAVVRAYRGGFATGREFSSLADVEANYKTWRGIAALAASPITGKDQAS